jgi:hypothetical protein
MTVIGQCHVRFPFVNPTSCGPFSLSFRDTESHLDDAARARRRADPKRHPHRQPDG